MVHKDVIFPSHMVVMCTCRAGPAQDDVSDADDMIGEDSDEDAAAPGGNRNFPSEGQRRNHNGKQPAHREVDRQSLVGSKQKEWPAEQQSRDPHQRAAERQHTSPAADFSGRTEVTGTSKLGSADRAGKELNKKHCRSKPISRLQRIAAEMQAKKVL